jgi:hypothetical protein
VIVVDNGSDEPTRRMLSSVPAYVWSGTIPMSGLSARVTRARLRLEANSSSSSTTTRSCCPVGWMRCSGHSIEIPSWVPSGPCSSIPTGVCRRRRHHLE